MCFFTIIFGVIILVIFYRSGKEGRKSFFNDLKLNAFDLEEFRNQKNLGWNDNMLVDVLELLQVEDERDGWRFILKNAEIQNA